MCVYVSDIERERESERGRDVVGEEEELSLVYAWMILSWMYEDYAVYTYSRNNVGSKQSKQMPCMTFHT